MGPNFKIDFSVIGPSSTSRHPDIPPAVLFPDAAGVAGTHPSDCETRFAAGIERPGVNQQVMKEQDVAPGRR